MPLASFFTLVIVYMKDCYMQNLEAYVRPITMANQCYQPNSTPFSQIVGLSHGYNSDIAYSRQFKLHLGFKQGSQATKHMAELLLVCIRHLPQYWGYKYHATGQHTTHFLLLDLAHEPSSEVEVTIQGPDILCGSESSKNTQLCLGNFPLWNVLIFTSDLIAISNEACAIF